MMDPRAFVVGLRQIGIQWLSGLAKRLMEAAARRERSGESGDAIGAHSLRPTG